MTATVIEEPARVHDLILWEEGMPGGEQRYTRKKATFKNKDSDHVAVNASGTVTLASPTATFVLTMAGSLAGAAGNLGAITLEVVQNASESVAYDAETGVLTVNANVTGGTNSVTELVALIHAHADFVVSGTTNGAGVVTTGTTGSGTISGGQDAVPVATEYQVGTPLDFVTDHYEPVTQANESSTAAVLLSHVEDIDDDEEVTVNILHAGPAIINMDALQLNDPYTDREAVMDALEALTPFSIDRVNEPVKQTSGT